jgi:ribonuclease R
VRLLAKLRDHPQGYILRTQVLRSLKKAAYRATPDGHFGLNKRDYTHFTSPIRRYSDLIVHRVFAHYVTKFHGQPAVPGAKVDYTATKLASLGEHLSQTEINSTEAERESVKVKLLEFFERELAKKKKTRFAAVITEARNHGMFIELTESMAFGLVHISMMDDDLYSLDPSGTALIGRRTKKRYAVGQHIEVVVARVDRFKRQVDFRLVGSGEAAPSTEPPSPKKKPHFAPERRASRHERRNRHRRR